MRAYALRRVALLVPTLLIASLIVFASIRVIPGDVIDLMLAQNDVSADRMTRERLVHALGLDRPVWEQYLRWVGGIVLHGDLGHSLWRGTPVTEQVLSRLPATFELGLLALIVSVLLSIPIGVYSAIRQDSVGDLIARSFSILLLAVPGFWIGTMIVVFPSIWWGWAPAIDYVPFFHDPVRNLKQMIVPAIVLGMALSGYTMRLTRTMMLEVLRQDYVRTAWAKGLDERLVVIRHALRNALLPVVTTIGMQASLLIGGAVIVEQIFSIPGLGSFLLRAVLSFDMPVIMGVVTMFVVVYVLMSLLVDISYGFLNPKVRVS
jgi:peptide/nickel transport system permease protein